jgi:hypothetical protein
MRTSILVPVPYPRLFSALLVGASSVVVLNILQEHSPQMLLAYYQQMIRALLSYRSHPAFSKRIRFG